MRTKIALVDDHVLLRNGLADHLVSLDYDVVLQANNGSDFIRKMESTDMPEIVLMDINMPVKDGFETTLWLKQCHPEIKVLALSMYDEEDSIIKMLRNGARGYILKDCELLELQAALQSVLIKGYHYSETITGRLIHNLTCGSAEAAGENSSRLKLNGREIEFLKLACTEMTYKEIADRMSLSPRTIDGYRDDLFEKLDVKSRVGLVLYAIKNSIVTV